MPAKPVGRKPRNSDDEFVKGFACAVGTLARNGYPSLAKDVTTCNGFDYLDLQRAGAEAYDLKPLREEFGVKSR